MSLKDKQSLYDLAGGYNNNSQPVSANNDTFPSTLEYYRDGGNNVGAPFIAEGGSAISKDHLVDLLTKKVKTNTLPPETKYHGEMSSIDMDMEGKDGGQGYWHGIANPGKGDGKQIGKKDLHVHLLENSYDYTHGNVGTNTTLKTTGTSGPGGLDFYGVEANTPMPLNSLSPTSTYANPDTGQVYNIN
tara:strand:+ start:214 stop:777 length:564 start_codon:yes stop_codon:yes gene_type:complete